VVARATRSRVSEGIDGKDAVGLYLEGIAKTPLLTAEEEVDLAKTIELGLYAEKILSGEVTAAERGKGAKRPNPAELEFLVDEGQRALQRFVTANLRLVVSVARK
jgi:DNA-directed RNA polymerase sigma subunit (sigma70/sigma32)